VRIVLQGGGTLAAELAAALAEQGREVSRGPEPGWEPPPAAALYVIPDPDVPPEPGELLAEEPARAYRFGLAALEAFETGRAGRLVYVVRSFASVRAAPAYPEAGIVGAGVAAVVRALAARAVGTDSTVNLLAVGLLARPDDERLARALAGPVSADRWVATKQGRLLELSELVGSLAFLLAPTSSLANGATVTVDRTLSTRF
jgi:hypothetical protein